MSTMKTTLKAFLYAALAMLVGLLPVRGRFGGAPTPWIVECVSSN